MVIPIQWPFRSWSDVRGWGLRRAAINLRGVEAAQCRIARYHASSEKCPIRAGRWTSGVQ
eukprot:432855-Pyramimonas_sp.AAC.1